MAWEHSSKGPQKGLDALRMILAGWINRHQQNVIVYPRRRTGFWGEAQQRN
jgi:hypothetical protein